MNIRIGGSSPIGTTPPKTPEVPAQVEAKLLAVRTPRRRSGRPAGQVTERRGSPEERDPRTGRVLVMMIPDAQQLPAGLDRGEFRVFLRFVRR